MGCRGCRSALVITTSLMVGACGGTEPAPSAGRQQAIVNGLPDVAHPAVGDLSHSLGARCSATLVGSHTVLTAAHCVAPGESHLFFLAQRRWPVSAVIPHPNYTLGTIANDIAVVRLAQAPPVEPAAVAVTPPQLGQRILLIGFGQVAQEDESPALKRMGENTIAAIDEQSLTYRDARDGQGNMCFGDSGGPTFAVVQGQEVVVGVHSYIRGLCGQEGNDMRVDIHRAWLRTVSEGDIREGGLEDRLPPQVAINLPSTRLLDPHLSLRVEATDDAGLAAVELFVDGVSQGRLSAPRYEVRLSLTPGEHQLEATARDYLGRESRVVRVVSVAVARRFGESCERAAQCGSSLCASPFGASMTFCSQRCDPTITNRCPGNVPCVADDGAGHICAPVALSGEGAPGGCALGSAAVAAQQPPLLLLLLGLVACWLAFRRRGGGAETALHEGPIARRERHRQHLR